ncbi:MAG: type 1 glutamine amidotransferase-like domain-containing protein [Candidatus Jacksonbacteria bacterium]|jgi:dipeptidase E|nr:type 1 glutamine amidotransferase-like domain-containing protein [Candidatus Jacksonbacteria bacterium]MBT6301174.1 type 1 glutamine amidotransferase-like domain-containing protein [Candidatus Jacksonbacteria bacterium]MBT6757647.1 type 1 glutamine amidotransferase-like domain-containing protein [Candidatus Jacksonbacteria bacterium]MBT7008333.1 type 1 glutamine amidotransferase-like domain-containing protein [Candidatus Jacksonbacteria bacterium]MBT7338875.1 type 1 glutamine amidotransferas
MKILILTSSSKFITRNNIDEYLPKKIGDCNIAYIITASKKVNDTGYLEKHKQKMDELGWDYTEIDIAGKNEEELKKELEGYDIVMVEGGNTFYLLKAVRESGFDRVIKDLIEKGVVYIGASAGSYIACPSIIMSTWSNTGFDRCGITDYTAMNLVPFLIKAHYTPDMKEVLEEKTKDVDYKTRILTDDQAIVVQGDTIKLLGGGEEIII